METFGALAFTATEDGTLLAWQHPPEGSPPVRPAFFVLLDEFQRANRYEHGTAVARHAETLPEGGLRVAVQGAGFVLVVPVGDPVPVRLFVGRNVATPTLASRVRVGLVSHLSSPGRYEVFPAEGGYAFGQPVEPRRPQAA